MEPSSGKIVALRRVVGVVLGLAWIGAGLGVGWAIGFLADQLLRPAHHPLILGTLGLCGVTLCLWAYGCRLIYIEVLAGVEAATSDSPMRRRTGNAWAAALAGPIVALVIGAATSGTSVHGAAGAARVSISAPAPARVAGPQGAVRPGAAAMGYVVRPGDSLLTIAEHFYGSPGDWSAIATANAGKLDEKSGARLVDPTLLPVGLELTIPSPDNALAAPHAAATTTAPTSSSRTVELFAALAGFGLIGTALFARRQRRWRSYQAMRAPAGGRPPRLSDTDAAIEAELRPLGAAELPEWIDAANRLLQAGLVADPSLVPPRISVVRAGPLGVEMLLDEANLTAPPGFVVLDAGRVWRLDPSLELSEVRPADGADSQPYIAGLVPVAEDESGSYLVACGPGETLAVRGSPGEIGRGLGAVVAHLTNAPWGEVALYRVGEASFVGAEYLQELSVEVVAGLAKVMARDPLWRAGLPEAQPIVLVEDPELAEQVRKRAPGIVAVIGAVLEAERVLFYEEGTVAIEPLGLRLPALLPSRAELEAVARLRAAASATPAVAEQLAALPSPAALLPVAAPVEVRILRPIPDIVGDVDAAKVKADVVQLVSYMALHGWTATKSRLRDIYGVYREESRAIRTVYNATYRAREVLGAERFPSAYGSEPYRLEGVSCDWLRFKQIVDIARARELAGQSRSAVDALTVALELLGDGPPGSHDLISGRYEWLDREQWNVELEATIVRAAHALAMLLIEHRPYQKSLDDAAWAIERGRLISPDARCLREAAMRLAEAREDEEAVTGEFAAAVDAVDALDIGEDVDPEIERLFHVLGPARRRTSAPGTAFA